MARIRIGHLKVVFQKKLLKFFKIYISIERTFNNDRIQNISRFLKKNRPVTTEFDLVRIGGSNDGGYLVPNDLSGVKYCFSPGVDISSSFEYDLHKNFNIQSFLSDYSVDKPAIDCSGFKFQKKFLDSKTDIINDTLSDWINKEKNNNEMILQMDIEGFEYDVLIETSRDILKKFRIILIEFHQFDQIFSQYGFKMIKSIFDKLNLDFYIVHIHPNKCCGVSETQGLKIPNTIEYTFIRKDRVGSIKNTKQFPHKLDHNKEFILPSNFYAFD